MPTVIIPGGEGLHHEAGPAAGRQLGSEVQRTPEPGLPALPQPEDRRQRDRRPPTPQAGWKFNRFDLLRSFLSQVPLTSGGEISIHSNFDEESTN